MNNHMPSATNCVRCLAGAALGILLLFTSAAAQISDNYDLSWSVLSNGGGIRYSANQVIHDATGQTGATIALGESTRVESGFIAGDLSNVAHAEGEGETPNEGEIPVEGEVEPEGEPAEGELEGEPVEGESVEGEGEGDPEDGCCGGCGCSGDTKQDAQRLLGDFLLLGLSLFILMMMAVKPTRG